MTLMFPLHAPPIILRFPPLCGPLEQGLLGNKFVQELGSFRLERAGARGREGFLGAGNLLSPSQLPSPLLCFSASFSPILPLPAFFLCLSVFSATTPTPQCLFPGSAPFATHPLSVPKGEEGLKGQGDTGRVEPRTVT